jgi:hypothetical protein
MMNTAMSMGWDRKHEKDVIVDLAGRVLPAQHGAVPSGHTGHDTVDYVFRTLPAAGYLN